MDRPPFSTVLSAAVASAAAFFVITRSGIAGTLAGAAVASLVYTGASHGVRHALERLVRRIRVGEPPAAEAPVDEARSAELRRPARSAVGTWGPLLLASGALVASLYSITTGSPIERVVVRERVVEKPVVTERVVVQTQTVTVTQPAQDHGSQPGAGTPTTTTTVAATGPAATTTTTSTAPPTTTTTSAAPPVSTTASTVSAP
jgi:hypothetical protein